MNCKQGDLAVVVRLRGGSYRGIQLGSIVECLSPARSPRGEPSWVIVRNGGLFGDLCIVDSALRPLRGNPGQDETLTWLPVPSTKVEKENVSI